MIYTSMVDGKTNRLGLISRWSFNSTRAFIVSLLLLAIIYVYLSRDAELPTSGFISGVGRTYSTGWERECDLFSGRWVYDNVSYPLYKEKDCKFMLDQLACEKYGRKDLSYQYWRWQPHDCDLPRFNAEALLERLRNKRMVFVGDSIQRGQWVSMVCLVQSAIPSDSLKSLSFHHNGSLMVFDAKEYNASIEHYWEPLLVESSADDPVKHRMRNRIVQVQAIEKHARHWSNADILVFNSYLWWRRPKTRLLWGSFGSHDWIYKDVKMLQAYEMALNTWSQWLEIHVNRSKTEMFFVSMSPTHFGAEEWGGVAGQNCHQETGLIAKEDYWGRGSDPEMMRVVERVIHDLKARGVTVQILNITQLSEYRKDAHPGIHQKPQKPVLEAEQPANPISYADCKHWCLPGVPDMWNELLYAYIVKNRVPESKNTSITTDAREHSRIILS